MEIRVHADSSIGWHTPALPQRAPDAIAYRCHVSAATPGRWSLTSWRQNSCASQPRLPRAGTGWSPELPDSLPEVPHSSPHVPDSFPAVPNSSPEVPHSFPEARRRPGATALEQCLFSRERIIHPQRPFPRSTQNSSATSATSALFASQRFSCSFPVRPAPCPRELLARPNPTTGMPPEPAIARSLFAEP